MLPVAQREMIQGQPNPFAIQARSEQSHRGSLGKGRLDNGMVYIVYTSIYILYTFFMKSPSVTDRFMFIHGGLNSVCTARQCCGRMVSLQWVAFRGCI